MQQQSVSDNIMDGLSFYAKIKAIGGIVITSCFLILGIIYFYYTYKANYVLATDSKITYKQNSSDTSNCDLSQLGCNYYAEYKDKNSNQYYNNIRVVQNKKPIIGSTTIYYKNDLPDQYSITSINPLSLSSIIIFIIFIMLIGACINYYLISTYKSYAVVQGGIQATNSVSSMFNRPSYNSRFNNNLSSNNMLANIF